MRIALPPAGLWFALYTLAILGCTAALWFGFHDEFMAEPSLSAAIRNLGLLSGGAIALGLAVWRSVVASRQTEVAQQQAETARRSVSNDRYQRVVELLSNQEKHIRIGALHLLSEVAAEDPKGFGETALAFLLGFVFTESANKYQTSGLDELNVAEVGLQRLIKKMVTAGMIDKERESSLMEAIDKLRKKAKDG